MPPQSFNPENQRLDNSRRPRVGLLGATLGTGNLGVDALGMSLVQGLTDAIPAVEIVYQTWDLRLPVKILVAKGLVECEPMAIRRKGTLRRRDGLRHIQKLARLRSWLSERSIPQLPTFSSTLKQLLSCDAILDVSAGDSFANIYGDDVFWYQTQIKMLCLELGIPLVLMPQTYGPFDGEDSSSLAANILSNAALVCSREAEGLAEVQRLCGDHPPKRLVRVPDMAFLLEPQEMGLPTRFQQARNSGSTCIALNISGLLYYARRSFNLCIDYQEFSQRLIQWALSVPDSHVLLVPHVVAPTFFPGAKSSRVASTDNTDTGACEHLAATLSKTDTARVDVLSPPSSPAHAKYAMSLCDYFVGARMHAFIGAASLSVPGTLLAYSKKAEGLASLLGIGDSVVDLRNTSLDDCINAIDAQFQHRVATKAHLDKRVPLAKEELKRFFNDEIAQIVLGQIAQTPANHQKLAPKDSYTSKKKVLS